MPPPSTAPLQSSPCEAAMPPRRSAAAHTGEYLYNQLIPYIGNKRKLLPLIARALAATRTEPCGLFVDLFAGSGVVSRFAKQSGFRVIANDWEPYAFEINNCFAASNRPPEFAAFGGAVNALDTLNSLSAEDGYIAGHLCPKFDDRPDLLRERLFFTHANGARIDAIRERVAAWERHGLIDAAERSYLLAPLLFAASYVSNTSGLFKAFHNGWGGRTATALYRILSDLHLRSPVLYDNHRHNEAWRMDAQLAAERIEADGIRPDIVYLDPPYNQHPYGSNYHLLNTITLWDKPAVNPDVTYGDKSAIRSDWRTERRSLYNSRRAASDAYAQLVATIRSRYILTSYSTDGTIPLPELLETSARAGRLTCVLAPYKRYRVSAQRRSPKPVNVEFVLIMDCSRVSSGGDVQECADKILAAEHSALSCHPETGAVSNPSPQAT